jgi:hypothetical protein
VKATTGKHLSVVGATQSPAMVERGSSVMEWLGWSSLTTTPSSTPSASPARVPLVKSKSMGSLLKSRQHDEGGKNSGDGDGDDEGGSGVWTSVGNLFGKRRKDMKRDTRVSQVKTSFGEI